MIRLLSAEAVRWRRSAPARLPLFALLAGLLEGLLYLQSANALHTWGGLRLWQNLWIVFLGPISLALLAGLAAAREGRARGGGTWWRPVDLQAEHATSFAYLAGTSLVMQGIVLVIPLPAGLIAHVEGAPPVGNMIQLWLVLWVTTLPALAFFDALARRLALIPTMIAGFVGAFAGVLPAEKAFWWLSPFAWSVRATTPLDGGHANGIPLEPGSPLWHISPWPMVCASVMLTPLLVWWGGRARPWSGRSRLTLWARAERRYAVTWPYQTGALGAELVKVRHTVLPWLTVLSPVAFSVIAFWRSPQAAWEAWALLVLPFGSALAAAIAWQWERDAWHLVRTHPTDVARCVRAKLALLWLSAALAALLLAALTLPLGMPAGRLAALMLLELTVGPMLIAFSLWVAVRIGVPFTLATGTVGTLLAAILGATGLGAHLWPFVPWTWAWVPSGETGATGSFALLSLILTAAFAWLTTRAAQRS